MTARASPVGRGWLSKASDGRISPLSSSGFQPADARLTFRERAWRSGKPSRCDGHFVGASDEEVLREAGRQGMTLLSFDLKTICRAEFFFPSRWVRGSVWVMHAVVPSSHLPCAGLPGPTSPSTGSRPRSPMALPGGEAEEIWTPRPFNVQRVGVITTSVSRKPAPGSEAPPRPRCRNPWCL